MRTTAAIIVELGKPLVVDQLEVPPLKEGQVLVEIAYSGVCHTQILEARGHRGEDPYLPHCLGHEGSGVVIAVGPHCTKVKEGDHVVISWIKGKGYNAAGTQYGWGAKKVNAGAVTTFGEHAIISENRLSPLAKEFPLKEAALIGCAVATGLGAAFNTARLTAGDNIAVFGCGGVGLAVLQGARIAGCTQMIAIDLNPEKLALAKLMGATHLIDASKEDVVESLKALGPIDFAFEVCGHPTTMRQALQVVRHQGGSVVIIGNARTGQTVEIDPRQLNMGKKILGSWGGESDPDHHFPRYGRMMQSGQFLSKPYTEAVYSLAEINRAMTDLEEGKVLRPLIRMKKD